MSGMRNHILIALAVVIILMTAGQAAQVSAASENSVTITIDFPAVSLEPAGDGTESVLMEDFSSLGSPGVPALPSKIFPVALPPGTAALSMRVVEADWSRVPGSHRVTWGQPPATSGDLPEPAEADSDVYGSDRVFPTRSVELLRTGYMRDVAIADVDVCPVTYRPESGILESCRSMTLTLEYGFLSKAPAGTDEGIGDSSFIYNSEQAESWYPGEVNDLPSASGDIADYLIITDDLLKSATDPIKNYKVAQGLSVVVLSTQEIYLNSTGADNQEKIRNFLRARYVSWGIDYVLIVGTDATVPMRRCYTPTDYSNNYPAHAYTPTDYYYSDLSGDWDLNDDGDWGECYVDDQTGGVDFYPEVQVGRIPNSTAAEITSICNKIVAFSQDSGAWKHKAILPGANSNFANEDGHGSAATWGSLLCEEIKDDITAPLGFSNYTLYERDGLAVDPAACSAALTKANFIDEWNNDYGIVTWWAHGLETSAQRKLWSSDDGDNVPEWTEITWQMMIESGDAGSLDNSHPGIVTAVSCMNAWPENTGSLAASLMKNGASAVVAGTRVTWYYPGSWGGNATMAYWFNKYLLTDGHRAGKALRLSDIYYRNSYRSDWDYQNLYGFNLFGDPSMKLDAEGPPTVTAISPNTHENTGSFSATVSGTNFLTGAQVTLTRTGQTTVQATGEAVDSPKSMTCTLPVGGLLYGPWNVVVTNPDNSSVTLAGGLTLYEPVPTISSLSPADTIVGSAGFSLIVNGTNFVNGAVVKWNGSNRATTFGSTTHLIAAIPAADLATTGTASVTVVNPGPEGGTSNAKTFTIKNPVPTTASIDPEFETAGDPGFTLTVNGTKFVGSSVVRWNNSDRATTYGSATRLTATINAADIATAGTANVTVFNAGPGGGTSNAQTFTIYNPVPTITTVDPTSVKAGGPAFTLTVNGTKFVNGAVVRWNMQDRTTTYVSSTKLTASISAADIATAGWGMVDVYNPGAVYSNRYWFPINYPTPTTTSLVPAGKDAGEAGFTLTVNGTNYVSGAVVKWNGSDRTTSYVNSTQLTASIDAADIANAGTAGVTVANPSPCASESNARTFTINNPSPTITSIDPEGVVAGGWDFVLTVKGTNFVSTSKVWWNGDERPTSFDSPTQLTAYILVSDTEKEGTASVTVNNPAPGGGTSNACTFEIRYPVPTVTGLSPGSVLVGSPEFEITLSGTNFFDGSLVKWNGTERDTKYVSVTELRARIPASDVAAAGTASVTVANPYPCASESNARTFNINYPTPEILEINPQSATAGGGGFELVVAGRNFVEGCAVLWNGKERITEFKNTELLLADITTSDIGTGGEFAVSVRNPAPCASDSNAATFTVFNSKPAIGEIKPDSASAGGEGFDLTVGGDDFVEGSVVLWGGEPRKAVYVSPSQLRVKIGEADIKNAGTVQVAVRNPKPGGGYSDGSLTFTVYNPTPATTGLSPEHCVAGDPGFTLTVNGTNFVAGSVARWNGSDRTTTYVSAKQLTASITAADIASVGTASVTVFNSTPGGGTSNAQTFTITSSPPTPTTTPTWYLAEGTSDWGFETYVTIANPNNTAVTAKVTYMTLSGAKTRPDVPLPAMSQTVINPRNDLGSRDFSTKVECKEGKTIAVDRRMIWAGPGAASPEGHSSVGVTAPAKTWYLPEGSASWGFECWLLIQNPNKTEATCKVTYMIENVGPRTVEKKIPANSRRSYNLAGDMPDITIKDASIKVVSNVPVIPERAMYRNNRREGHCSIGTTTPAKDYYLAEGTTDWGFTTYVLIQNPNNAENKVTVTYMTPTGKVPTAQFTMPANSRKTIKVNDVLPGKDLSTHVQGTLPIIAERAMYWNNGTGEACHDSVGMDTPHATFYLPDGETGGPAAMETWTLVQNPNSTDVQIQVSYLTPSGTGNVVFTETIPVNSRKSFSMSDRLPNARAAIMVTSKTTGKKIMCERAMYWNSRGAGTDTIGGYSD